jgi:hypothetical protein
LCQFELLESKELHPRILAPHECIRAPAVRVVVTNRMSLLVDSCFVQVGRHVSAEEKQKQVDLSKSLRASAVSANKVTVTKPVPPSVAGPTKKAAAPPSRVPVSSPTNKENPRQVRLATMRA